MAINRVSFTTDSLKSNTDVTLELVSPRPDTTAYLDTPVTPNKMVGFYNSAIGVVELYITDGTGRRYIKVQ